MNLKYNYWYFQGVIRPEICDRIIAIGNEKRPQLGQIDRVRKKKEEEFTDEEGEWLEKYESFEDKFGHIFYTKKKFKNYHLSLEYKFSGKHLEGAPGWSIKNSGIMLHCQDPNTMLIDQEFPVSAEMQLLGGLGDGERSTANICTPGTDVDIDGQIAQYHCINSNSLTYNEDEWVNVEVIVYSDSIIHHIVESDTVLSYTNIRVGGGEIPDNYVNRIGERLSDGFISLQSEGHPVEFRDIKIRELK